MPELRYAECENSGVARYFGIDEANDRLAQLRPMLEQLRADRDRIAQLQRQLTRGRETNGSAEHAEQLAEIEDDERDIVHRMQASVSKIDEWGVTLRDISTGTDRLPGARERPTDLAVLAPRRGRHRLVA